MLEALILGTIQGVAEWLPISSEGAIIAVRNIFFSGEGTLLDLIRFALFLHLGTFLAALVYLRRDVWHLVRALTSPREQSDEVQYTLAFLIVATAVSGVIGFGIFTLLERFEHVLVAGTAVINILIALMLCITGFLQLRSRKDGLKGAAELSLKDGLILGLAQGLAVIPGLSRSGLTVSVLLLRKFEESLALRLSFLMSLPIVLAGNIALNPEVFTLAISPYALAALAAAFVSGIVTIDLLLRFARRVNFGYFALFFAALVALSIFV